MANPVIVNCPEGEWTKVATNVTTGVIHIINDTPAKYTQTYRLTGQAAPTLFNEAVPFDEALSISASVAIDVYVWPVGSDGVVRADL